MRRLVLLLCCLLCPLGPAAAVEAPTDAAPACHAEANTWIPGDRLCIAADTYRGDVCRAIERLAARWALPEGFLARLIWQESRFDPNAVSPAGAEGIAQFMPSTARLRGLDSSFNPAEALARSAEYLAVLRSRFGNLGLAAAAYNGGEAAVAGWLAGRRGLAAETRAYVRIITGLGVDDWRRRPWLPLNMALSRTAPFRAACEAMARGVTPVALRQPAQTPAAAWGVVIAQHASEDVARRIFERVQKRFPAILGAETPVILRLRNPSFGPRPRPTALVGRPTESEARSLCRRLLAAGGTCTIRRT